MLVSKQMWVLHQIIDTIFLIKGGEMGRHTRAWIKKFNHRRSAIKKKLKYAFWGKRIKLVTVIAQVVTRLFLVKDPFQICAGKAHCALGRRGHGPFGLVRKRMKEGRKAAWKKYIPIFLTVAKDEPYKIPVTCFFERFYENISTKCVNDSCQKEKPSEGRN